MLSSISKCRSCGAAILWMKTKNKKNIPVDWDARFVDDTEFSIPAGHISHFSTCPDAGKHRTVKRKKNQQKSQDGEVAKYEQQELQKEMFNEFGLTPMKRNR